MKDTGDILRVYTVQVKSFNFVSFCLYSDKM